MVVMLVMVVVTGLVAGVVAAVSPSLLIPLIGGSPAVAITSAAVVGVSPSACCHHNYSTIVPRLAWQHHAGAAITTCTH
jgi:hypothetical protein